MPVTNYTTTQSFSRTITRAGGSSATFTRITKTTPFSRFRYSITSTRTANSIAAESDPREEYYTTTYTGNYTGDFIGNYSRNYSGNYTGDFIGNYIGDFTGNYARDFIGGYSRTFVGNYARDYVLIYSRTYTRTRPSGYARSFIGNYARAYTRSSTRTSSYTRILSGGSGETPVNPGNTSPSEYGLVVYGPDGITEIINPTTRVFNMVFNGSVTVAGNGSTNLTIEDVGDPSKVVVSTLGFYNGITLTTSGNTLTVTNSSGFSRGVSIIAIRI